MIGKYLTADGVWVTCVVLGVVLYCMVGVVLLVVSPSRRTLHMLTLGALCWLVAGALAGSLAGSLTGLLAGIAGAGIVSAIGLTGLRQAGHITRSNLHG